MASSTARFGMRLSKEQKSLLEQAAAVRGQDLTCFALGILLKEASEIVTQHTTRTLSQRDMRALLRLLKKPPAPNAALKRAFRRFVR